MDILVLIGRILFSVIFLSSAVGHFTQTKQMAGYARSRGVPSPELATVASGVLLAVGGLMVLLGIWPDLGALLLVLFLLPSAVLMHAFWKESDAGSRQAEMLHFNKDISLAGAALALFALFAYAGSDLGLTLTGPLFSMN
ncbi:DoxX family protein [Streptomyces sp. ACA25]|uniref:DoxX family protein n=1 Tax=Streptomyces sp. ACA25 TaxID=3022596 RepID=UPI00230761AB|nr:DoxX family protein [Streptomyces sp. ACA25]MDB1086605.1 DoxX family protein [Streptomyces sp. ACA25]